MVRTKTVARKSTASQMVSLATVNTRIQRALASRTETKRAFFNSTLSEIASAQQRLYVNPLASIGFGSGPNERVGDQIQIVGMEFYISYVVPPEYAIDTTFENTLVKSNVGSATSSSLAYYVGASLKYIGFETNGPDNTENYTVLSKKKHHLKIPIVAQNGGFRSLTEFSHKMKMNKKVIFETNSNVVKQGNILYLMNMLHAQTINVIVPVGFYTLSYIVHYKDF